MHIVFLESGHFEGELGDLMVLTLANVLNIPIVLFTSVPNMPVLCVTPASGIPSATSVPLFLTFMVLGITTVQFPLSLVLKICNRSPGRLLSVPVVENEILKVCLALPYGVLA